MAVKKIKGGCFRTMGLHSSLLANIHFQNPTPIQRKAILPILEGKDIIGIARTGSGKTLAYLVPALQKAIAGSNVVIIVPTRELCTQVYKILCNLAKNTEITHCKIAGGENIENDFESLSNPKRVILATVGRLTHLLHEMKQGGAKINLNTKMLIVDEVDRVLEEGSMKKDLDALLEYLPTARQNVFFSATLPYTAIALAGNAELIKIDSGISDTLNNFFFYVPTASKDAALLYLIEKVKNRKSVVFVNNKYTAEQIFDMLPKYDRKIIYSSMDQQARNENLQDFETGSCKILIVTDLAARGLDVPLLDVVINYDMTDEKTFLHRIGRAARNGKEGWQYTLVTYADVFHFFDIRESLFKSKMEIGHIPQTILDEYGVKVESKRMVENANEKSLKFRKKVSVPQKVKEEIKNIKTHSFFDNGECTLLDVLKNKFDVKKEEKEVKDFKDQFYIPYTNKNSKSLHSSAYSIMKDENGDVKNKKRKNDKLGDMYKQWEKKKKVIFNKRA